MEKDAAADDEAYYRQRTVARLIDKRRQMEDAEQKEAEAKKLEELKFRVQWKEGFKKKRSEMISNKIDKAIMRKMLQRNPEMLVQVMNMEKYGIVDTKEEESLTDLIEEYDERELGTPGALASPLPTRTLHSVNSFNPGNILTAPRSQQALQFLQNSATFNLAVNKRIREQHLSQAQHGPLIKSFGDSRRSSMQSVHSDDLTANLASLHAQNSTNTLGSANSGAVRPFSSYRNESQVNSLVLHLLDDAPPHNNTYSTHNNSTIETRPRVTSNAESSLFNTILSRKIKTTGLMSKIIQSSTAAGLSTKQLERSNSFSIHRSNTPASRMFASKNKDNNTLSGASGVNSMNSNSDEVDVTNTDAMFCSLVDSIFLIGPSAQSVYEQIAAHSVTVTEPLRSVTSNNNLNTTNNTNNTTNTTNTTNTNNATTTTTTVPDFNTVLPSTMLFVTENHCPPEMAMLLPAYCFPSGVELGVRSKSTTSSTTSTTKRRKNSLNLLTQKIITESITDAVKGVKKKNTAFFPSDFAMSMGISGNKGEGGSTNNTNNANNATSNAANAANNTGAGNTNTTSTNTSTEPTLPAINQHVTPRNQFILLLGDHTYQQYGVCVQLPTTIITEDGITIHTSYVLCMMTKFPLFNYLYHLLDQYDAIYDGLKFKRLIPTQDVTFPFVAELKPLSDLATKLKRLLVPKYPYVMNMNAPLGGNRRRANTEASGMASPVTIDKSLLESDYPALDNESDIRTILPDVEFIYGGINTKKLTAIFKRSAYQAYFSSVGSKYDTHNKNISELIGRYDKLVADFVPNVLHKAEKEREDAYMIMLWALPVLLKYLPLDQIILALGCAITEMKIIVMHPNYNVISSVIMALMQLLRPLRWCPPVIVILPDQYQEIIESPTPVMIGMPRLPEHFTLLEGFVVIDPQERIVHLNPIDVVESHTILLPHGSKLVNALSASAETILKCTKKKRSTRFRKSVGGDNTLVDLLNDNTNTNTNTSGAPSPAPPLPLPVELDLNSYENLQLLAAVKTFMGIVSNHIQAILNTAIQMQQQSKKASQDQRRLLIKSGSLPRGAITSHKKSTKSTVPIAANTTNTSGANGGNNTNANTSSNNNHNSSSMNMHDTDTTHTLPTAASTTNADSVKRPQSINIDTTNTNTNTKPNPTNTNTTNTYNTTANTTSPLPRTASNNPLPRVNSSVTELNLFMATDKHVHSPVAAGSNSGANSARRDSTNSTTNTTNTANNTNTNTTTTTNATISPSPKGAANKAKLPFKPSPKQTTKGRRQSEFGMRSPEADLHTSASSGTSTGVGAGKNKNTRHSLPLLRREEEDDGPPTTSTTHTSTTHTNTAHTNNSTTPQITPRGGIPTKTTKLRSSMLKDNTTTNTTSANSKKLVSKASDMSMGIAGKSRKTDKSMTTKSSLHDIHDTEKTLHTNTISTNTLHSHKTTTSTSNTNTTSSDDPFQELNLLIPDTIIDSTEPLTPPPLTHIHSTRHNSSNALVFTIDSLMSPMSYPVSNKTESGIADTTHPTTSTGTGNTNTASNPNTNNTTSTTRAPVVPRLSLTGTNPTTNTTNTAPLTLPIHPHNTHTTHTNTTIEPEQASPTFDNLPYKADSNSEDGPRDSLNDETCSEITVTDAGLHRDREEDSLNSLIGVGIRETSSNDSGDKSEGSVCSSASSLPSLKSNAPLLLVREIGQSGAKFIDKIQETQMYSNYCNYVKTQSALAAAKLAADTSGGNNGSGGGNGGGTSNQRALAGLSQVINVDMFEITTPSSPRARKGTAWSQLNPTEEDLYGVCDLPDPDEDEEIALDSLQEVFGIMLTGTVEMREEVLEPLQDRYDDLYAHSAPVDVAALRLLYKEQFSKAQGMDVEVVFAEAVRRFHTINTTSSTGNSNTIHTSHAATTTHPSNATTNANSTIIQLGDHHTTESKTPDSDISWCNGLLCNGLCNTAYCTEICILLWEHKVKRLRQTAVFKNILMKRHNHTTTAHTTLRTTVFSPDKRSSLNKVEVVKHHRETQSQFEQRKLIAENKRLDLLRSMQPDVHKTTLKEKHKSIYGPSHGGKKRRLYARGTTDPATLAIAKHYAHKQMKVQRSQVRKAMAVIKPLMLRFVCLYRRYKFFNAIYIIQALIRGFYVRNHIPELVEALIARRIRRLLACLRIRRFLRQRADQIYKRHVRAKMDEQRRRRATLSIPVKSAADLNRPNSPKNTHSSHSHSQRTPRRIYSLSDDVAIIAGLGSAPVGVSRALPPTPTASSTSGSTGSNSGSGGSGSSGSGDSSKQNEDVAQLTNEKAVLDLAAAETTANTDTNTDLSHKDANSSKEAHNRTPRYSTGTYTDRVKEYLQFGKITHRNSVAAMPQTNKYAAHYMQKRNSKTAKDTGGLGVGSSPVGVIRKSVESPTGTDASAASLSSEYGAGVGGVGGDSGDGVVVQGEESARLSNDDNTHLTSDKTDQDDVSFDLTSSPEPTLQHAPHLPHAPHMHPDTTTTTTTATTAETLAANTAAAEHLRTLRKSLYISTRFSSEDSSEVRSQVSAESFLGSPASAFTSVRQERTATDDSNGSPGIDHTDNDQNDNSDIPPPPVDDKDSVLSPTSGIRTYSNVVYDDSDEELDRSHSLKFSKFRASDMLVQDTPESSPTASGSQLSLLAMNLVEGSLKHVDSTASKFSSIEEYHQYNRATHSFTAHAPGDEDDRASVLSSGSNSTTPKRRLSSTASTDADASQPVLLSILGIPPRPPSLHNNNHNGVTSALSASTESLASGDNTNTNTNTNGNSNNKTEPLLRSSSHDVMDGHLGHSDDLMSVSSGYSRNGQRSSFGSINSLAQRANGSKQATLLMMDDNQMKKLSPIGRYAAEKSYDMTRLFSSRNPAAPFSRVPFQPAHGSELPTLVEEMNSEKSVDVSPIRIVLPPNPARATPRVGILGGQVDTSRYSRRQAFVMSGASGMASRRFSGSSEDMLAPDKQHQHQPQQTSRPGMFRVQSDRLADINSLSRDTTFGSGDAEDNWSPRRAGIQRYASQGSTPSKLGIGGIGGIGGMGGMGGWGEENKNTAIVSDSLTYSELHSNSVSAKHHEWPSQSEENQLHYHRHVRPGSPKIPRDTDSPVRPNSDYRYAIDAEMRMRKSDPASIEPMTVRFSEHSKSTVTSERPPSASEERAEGYGGFGEDLEDDEDDELEFLPLDDIKEAIKVAPLKTLGCNVHEFINRQQLHTLLDMWRLLRSGVEVLKHGRRGNPKFKTLLCDVNLTKLYWRSQGSKADPDQDDLAEDLRYHPTLLDPTAGSAELCHGVSPLESMPTSNTSRLARKPFGAKSNADRVLYIRDIVAVRDDCGTEVMQRSLHKKFVTMGHTSIISIILNDRTLDFEIEEEPWNALFRALQILVNFYQVMVPGPRMTMSSSGPPSGFFNFLTYDTTGPSNTSMYNTSTGSGTGSARKRSNSSALGGLLSRRASRAEQEDGTRLL